MATKAYTVINAVLSVLSLSPTAAFQLNGGGLPRYTRGGDKANHPSSLSAAPGFDIGEWLRQTFSLPSPKSPAKEEGDSNPSGGRGCTNAVLVLGGTGKTGRCVVEALLAEGRDVVVAARTKEAAEGLALDTSIPGLYIQIGVDVRDEASLKDESLFDGVSQVVSALGPRFGEEGSSSEIIDYKGVESAIEAAEACLSSDKAAAAPSLSPSAEEERVLITPGEESGEKGPGGSWQPLDDVIMGGRSSSAWQAGVGRGVLERMAGERFGRWAGNLVTEGGGFCGTVVDEIRFDTADFDGIRVHLRGDGNRYKFRLKLDTGIEATPERLYQAAFDTVPGEWIEVDLPFENFVAVKRNEVDFGAPRVNEGPGGKILSLGIILSRFSFNEYPNAKFKAGSFQLDVKDISLYRKPRPNFILVSSASAERYHRLSEEERKNDIPIVALNPGGILNWKYKAEERLRRSPLRHCVVRPTGLIPEGKEGDRPVRLEVGQGDTISGRVSRKEVGRAVAAALASPYTAGKTFEIRRDEAEDAPGQRPDFTSLFRGLILDEDRSLASTSSGVGGLPLPPFAMVQDPPPPVSEERKAEILNDPRVKAQQQSAKEGREEKKENKEEEAAAAVAASSATAAAS